MEDEVVSIELDRDYKEIEALRPYVPKNGERSVDIQISHKNTLDHAIQILQSEKYQIRAIQPKSGRLEEFFIKSTKR